MHRIMRVPFFSKPLIAAAATLFTSISATADDLDVFDAIIASQNKPNIMFVLDYSGSMRNDVDGNELIDADTSPLAKVNILKAAVDTLLEENAGKINVGIGSLYDSVASGVRWPVSDIEADANTIDPAIPAGVTVADAIMAQLNRSNAGDGTATVNGLAEAAAYFRGDQVLHNDIPLGDAEFPQIDVWNGTGYDGGSKYAAIPASYDPSDAFASNVIPSYVSPLTKECQSNFIVLISDGKPTVFNDNAALTDVLKDAGMPGGNSTGCEDLSTTIFTNEENWKTQGNCGSELLEYLATTDINPDIEGSNVKTFTVGFSLEGTGKEYLQLLADKGQGDFYEASQPAELTEALNNVIDSILAGSQNFSELSIDVDPNSFSHDNRTYFSLFTPSGKSSWQGNLKGYFIDESGLLDVNGNAATVTDEAGLRFADTAQSFWSSAPDGTDVMAGGASESITDITEAPVNRNIHTYVGGDPELYPGNDDTRLAFSNPWIDDDILGNPGAAAGQAAFDWLATAPMGDPLHTKPVSVNYGATQVVYVMTNQGFIHAFDATKPTTPGDVPLDLTGGEELFAFMPKELLSNIPKLHSPNRDDDHVYGLDGKITRWHDDGNGNGIVDNSESVVLVFGMRRGGTSYYALDVSNPNRPEVLWQISAEDNDFADMAQTWSRASLVTVAINDTGDTERMLMFAGGFDADVVDGKNTATESSGNAIYMVDANGEEVWTLNRDTDDDLKYSIPGDITVIDTDQNGRADRAYFGDLGGQIWRIDFDNVYGDVELTKLADVSNGDYQPIFYAPSVSMNRDKKGRFLAISFGTGDRTQPLREDSHNAFYMLKDRDIKTGAPDVAFASITENDLHDATLNPIGSDHEQTQNDARTDLNDSRGWVVYLNDGEKSLSKVVAFEGKYLATTFEPDPSFTSGGVPDPCSFNMIGRLYVMNLLDARPIAFQSDGSESIVGPDAAMRSTTLSEKMTIPGSPTVVLPEDTTKVQIVVGKESVVSVNKLIRTVFWHSK